VVALDEPVSWDDWPDVVRRSRDLGRWARRVWVLAGAGVAVAVAGVTFTLRPSPPAHVRSTGVLTLVRQDFAGFGLGSPPVLAPGAAASQTRVITSLRVSGGSETDSLYVSPAKQGGFCYEWTGGAGGCELRVAALAVAWGTRRVVGAVSSVDVSSVTIKFSDGTSARPEISWVAAPVNAGFFLYEIPAGKIVAEVIADDGGRTQGRVPWYV